MSMVHLKLDLWYHEWRQLDQDNSWATSNKRSPFPGTLNSTITIAHRMDRQEVIISKCNEMPLFCRAFWGWQICRTPPPSLNSCPPPLHPKKGKKSEGRGPQKGTKMINCLKMNDLHAIFTHFANIENYPFFYITWGGGAVNNLDPPPFTKFWVHPKYYLQWYQYICNDIFGQ